MAQNNNSKNIFFLITMIIILVISSKFSSRKNILSNNYEFTIGKTIKYEFYDGFKDCITYEYYIDDKKFTGSEVIDPKVNLPINKYFKVKFSKMKPNISELNFSEQVIDSSIIIKAGFKF